MWVTWKKLEENYSAHEPSKQFQNLLEIYSVVSRELTTLWLRNLDINYKSLAKYWVERTQIMTNLLCRINHKTFNGLSTQHEKQYLGILHGSREKWYRIRFSLESSRHLAMLTALVSSWNDASDERAQNWIPYWWRVTTQIWEINKNSSRQQKTDTGYR